jgi:hypothetical protein
MTVVGVQGHPIQAIMMPGLKTNGIRQFHCHIGPSFAVSTSDDRSSIFCRTKPSWLEDADAADVSCPVSEPAAETG